MELKDMVIGRKYTYHFSNLFTEREGYRYTGTETDPQHPGVTFVVLERGKSRARVRPEHVISEIPEPDEGLLGTLLARQEVGDELCRAARRAIKEDSDDAIDALERAVHAYEGARAS